MKLKWVPSLDFTLLTLALAAIISMLIYAIIATSAFVLGFHLNEMVMVVLYCISTVILWLVFLFIPEDTEI